MSWLFGRGGRSPEDRFEEEIVGLARSVLGIKAERIDGFRLRLEPPGGSAVVMNLGAIFAEARQLTGEARAARLRTAVLAMIPPPRPETWDEAASKLMPAIRAVSWLSAPGMRPPVNRPFMPFLRLLAAIDSEHALSYASDDDLMKWGVDADRAFAGATANLEKRAAQVGRVGQIAIVMGPDGYTSSWLAAPQKLARMARDLAPEVVAIAATRDTLVLVDTADVDAMLKAMHEELKSYQEAPRQLSPVPYRVTDSGIEPWDPPQDHPARPWVERAQRVLANTEYGIQKPELQDRLTQAGEDVFVASYALMQRADGSVYSWAAWSKQVGNGLVPRTDVLFLGDVENKANSFWVGWDDAIRIAGDSLRQELALDPPRWRYRGWPEPSVVEALRARAHPPPPSATAR